MKKTIRLCFVFSALLSSAAFSQTPVKDSLKLIKQQKEITKITKSLEEQKLKLVTLQDKVDGMKLEDQKKADDAKSSSADNERAASKLNDDINDKKKARQVRTAANQAAQDAKQSRRASADLKNLQDDIKSLTKKIAANEEKLQKLLIVPEQN